MAEAFGNTFKRDHVSEIYASLQSELANLVKRKFAVGLRMLLGYAALRQSRYLLSSVTAPQHAWTFQQEVSIMATYELKSKLIDAIEYDDETTELRVHLSNGQRRHVRGICQGLVTGFVLAKSPGDFYISHIRGKFPEI